MPWGTSLPLLLILVPCRPIKNLASSLGAAAATNKKRKGERELIGTGEGEQSRRDTIPRLHSRRSNLVDVWWCQHGPAAAAAANPAQSTASGATNRPIACCAAIPAYWDRPPKQARAGFALKGAAAVRGAPGCTATTKPTPRVPARGNSGRTGGITP